jgi:hypothetical protein
MQDRFRALIHNVGREFNVSTPGKPHILQINIDTLGCDRYLPDGAFDFPGTIRATLDELDI